MRKETKRTMVWALVIVGVAAMFMIAVTLHYRPRDINRSEFNDFWRFTSQMVMPDQTLSSMYDGMCQAHPLTSVLYTRGEWIAKVVDMNGNMNANDIMAGNFILLPYYTAVEPSDE